MSPSVRVRGIGQWSAWIVVIASIAGLGSAYWDDSWHTTLGRDSVFIPPHSLLYLSFASVGTVLGFWGIRLLSRSGSIRALAREPGFLLAAASAAATVAAAPVDAYWHTAFGRDAVLWSPPHLLSVIATTVLLAAILVSIADRPWPRLHIGVSAVLLAASQIVVMEYETDVPQFTELVYLPIMLFAAVAAAWVITRTTEFRFALTAAVIVFLAFRAALTVGLTAAGWLPPDLPLALLGLVAVDVLPQLPRLRWAVAAAAVAILQTLLAATGFSSVAISNTIPAAIAIAGLALMVVVTARFRSRISMAVVVVLVCSIGFALTTPSPASAHDPGQGAPFGTVTLSILGNGTGGLEVQVTDIRMAPALSEPAHLIARRAGVTITAPLRFVGTNDATDLAGSIRVPSSGRWFVYAEISSSYGTLEAWMPVENDLSGSLTEARTLYQPAGSKPWIFGQFLLAGLLLGTAAGLVAWLATALVRLPRSRRR
ncbi:hypothetical protein ACF1AJ_20090 [Leifsonia sp. NPDC014704]|uniref:hypothetical protein n=1 Tax=unclassified Leifsonia TaxID=2663824 RepID=UPI000A19B2F7|nr:hypothetical protein [Leifsonia sp. NCR5]